jgi:hypothetical protein
MTEPWEGFWQVLSDSVDEEVVPFRNTTIALRHALEFVVLTRSHFMEIGQLEKRPGPFDRPPTQQEAVTLFRSFRAFAGRCNWRKGEGGWLVDESVTMASDPRLEGTTIQSRLEFDGDRCLCHRNPSDGKQQSMAWRRLSGAGTSDLAGAWETGGQDERWIYLVTAGHYGVMRVSVARPRTPSHGKEFSDDEIFALSEGFGANAGARLETSRTFDHWPMIGNGALGYEARKHPTFRIESREKDRIVLSIPLRAETGEAWHRLD